MNFGEFPVSRQKVLFGAGLGLVTAVVAACSTYGKKPEAASESATTTVAPAPSASGGPAVAATGNVIAKTADVPVGSGLIVDKVVVTQPTAGVFKGFSSTCTHAGCTVNKIADGTIDCPCHGSKYN